MNISIRKSTAALFACGLIALPCWLATSGPTAKSASQSPQQPLLARLQQMVSPRTAKHMTPAFHSSSPALATASHSAEPQFQELQPLAMKQEKATLVSTSSAATTSAATTASMAATVSAPVYRHKPDVARLEHLVRRRWELQNPQLAHLAARPGSYQEIAHLVPRSNWNALNSAQRAMITSMVRDAKQGIIGVMPCFAPGTDMKVVQAFEGLNNSLGFFRVGGYWANPVSGPHTTGAPMTLRWSIVPDGTALPSGTSGGGEAASNSSLRANLNAIYGNEATWRALFRQVFARWSSVSGVRYIEEPNDDGAAITATGTNPGVVGVRGDVRISGHNIDGVNGILAYDYFPDVGDMVIDTGDMTSSTGFFRDTSNNSLGFRNVITHEHGHGLGFAHVCPINETKLMEPFVSYNFDGPQTDDIQNAQRGYGDTREDNDTQATATDLGALANGTTSISTVSIDSNTDLDFYKFSTNSAKNISATLRPIGGSYLEGAQNNNGSCTAGTTFNAVAQRDLQIAVLNASGQVVAQVNATGAGANETLPTTRLPAGAGPFSVRVSGNAVNLLQLYNLDLTLSDAPSGAFFQAEGTQTVSDTTGNGNGNGRPDPGESSLGLTIPLRNVGDVTATTVKGTLVSLTSGVTVSQPSVSYPNTTAGSTATNLTLPTFSVSPSFVCGTSIQFRLDVSSDQGNSSASFTVATGAVLVQTYAYSGAAVPIPDGTGANTAGAAVTATVNVSGASTIADLDFALNNLTHSYVGDLVIKLTSPAGTTVTVVNRIGNGQTAGPNFTNTVLDDEATSSIQNVGDGSAPYTSSYTPANPLSAFDGQNPNGTWTVNVQDFYNGDVGTLTAFSLRLSSTQCGVPAPVVAPTSGALISEYRLSGPGGNNDEFIELINTTGSPLDISGWSVLAGSLSIPIPASTSPIPSRGHLLLTGSSYSLANLGGTGAAAGNVLFTSDIPTGSALALRNVAGTIVDQTSSSGMPVPPSATDNYSYVRRLESGLPQDTDSDVNDFNLVDVQSTVGPNNQTGTSNGILRLGAPGPENLGGSPQFNTLITFTPANPASVRVGSGNGGTMALRYVVTNRAGSGKTISALRFRMVALTAGTTVIATDGTASVGPADIRLISSTSSGGTILPLILETPPAQPNGGGLNSTISLAGLPGGSLAPGQSVTVEMLYNVVQRGFYRFSLNFEPVVSP